MAKGYRVYRPKGKGGGRKRATPKTLYGYGRYAIRGSTKKGVRRKADRIDKLPSVVLTRPRFGDPKYGQD